MSNFVYPTISATAFNCPYCNAYANMDWGYTESYLKYQKERTRIWVARGQCCNKNSYWWVDEFNETLPIKGHMVLPIQSMAPMPHEEMPEQIKSDYLEARAIVGQSSRGACALLRLAIQNLCLDLGYTSGKINRDIASMVEDGLPVQIQQALDIVRVVGNNAVHPGELVKDDVDEIAIGIFHLINEIVEDRVAKPKRISALYNKLPSGAVEAIQKRDQ